MSETKKINAKRHEEKLLKSRDSNLSVLAFGTLITMHMVGGFLGSLIFDHWLMVSLSRLGLMFIGYSAIDGSVKNYLSAMSSDDGVFTDGAVKNRLKNSAKMVLLATILFSIVSNFFVSDFMVGESNYKGFNKEVFDAIKRDSSLKVLAMGQLSSISETAKQDLIDSRNKAKSILEQAVNSGGNRWKKDYLAHKDNRAKWFWKCKTKGTTCPQNYIDYRNRILAAEEEGRKIISESVGGNEGIKNALASTLSYKVSADSTLVDLSSNVGEMESERKWSRWMIIGALSCLVLISGFFAYRNTIMLVDLRSIHGQQAEEKDSLFELVVVDFVNKILQIFLTIISTVIIQPYHWIRKSRFVLEYTLNGETIAKTKTKNYKSKTKTFSAKFPIDTENEQQKSRYNDGNGKNEENETKPKRKRETIDITNGQVYISGSLVSVSIKTTKNDIRYFKYNGSVFIIHKGRNGNEKAIDLSNIKTNLNSNRSKLKNGVGVPSTVQKSINLYLEYFDVINMVNKGELV